MFCNVKNTTFVLVQFSIILIRMLKHLIVFIIICTQVQNPSTESPQGEPPKKGTGKAVKSANTPKTRKEILSPKTSKPETKARKNAPAILDDVKDRPALEHGRQLRQQKEK
ncbi:MAG: hypothetical protein KG003_00965 [Bacteroidetes bacterium]|nr:hypothetical protein [Bacteroidota bacterium]